MSRADGEILGTTKIVDHGSGATRWDLVVIGDGYTRGEMAVFERQAGELVDFLFATPPFDELKAAINVHRVNVASRESGASNLCDGTTRATFFESRHCGFNIDRLLVTNNLLALDVAIDAVPEMNGTLMMVNSEIYGGSGGAVPVFSSHPDALEIAVHEMGHSHFGLADEYPARESCQEADHDRYLEPEPLEPNVTVFGDGRRWSQHLTPSVPLPSMENPDCADCDTRVSPFPPGTIGTFEGARYFRCGLFRPSYDCRMRNLGVPFCAVCQDVIRTVLAPFVHKVRKRGVRR
jgi:hypothetical protein